MTEDEIEREVEARTDRLDAKYLASPMTESAYHTALDAIDAWAAAARKEGS
jgi:hypothetical protein